jgi:hypothetical protein
MDNLNKEQLLLLQQNLTYEVYEQFMNLFPKDGLIPTNESEKNELIISLLKEHDYFGKISGWGDNRFYENIPNDFDNSSLKTMIYKELHNTIKTKYELINYLNNYPYKELLKHELKNIKLFCMPFSFKQVPMIDRWKNDNVF